MLVLTRSENQRIMIGSDVIVTIVRVDGQFVRVGVDAPKGVRVDREEVRARVDREDREREGRS